MSDDFRLSEHEADMLRAAFADAMQSEDMTVDYLVDLVQDLIDEFMKTGFWERLPKVRLITCEFNFWVQNAGIRQGAEVTYRTFDVPVSQAFVDWIDCPPGSGRAVEFIGFEFRKQGPGGEA